MKRWELPSGTVWGRQNLGTGESGVDRRKGTRPLHAATTGSAHMEMASLENPGPFSRVKRYSTILCLYGQLSLSACSLSPRYTDNKSGGVGFFFKFSFIN